MSFVRWMQKVNALVWARVGCSAHDLPDCSFRAWYDDGMSASEAATCALENAGW